MPGSSSFASGWGGTKSGITNWSSESRVSRTSPRSEAVRRKRRSRVTGNALTRARVRLFELDADVGQRTALAPRLELDALLEELPHRLARSEERQRNEDPREAVDLA